MQPSTQSGSGAISGTVTATGASGRALRVYCQSTTKTVTFSGDTANYTLNVPYGSHVVTATVVGHKTTTQLVTVNAGTPHPTANFTLPAIQRRIDISIASSRILPDGVSETTVTAIVRDEEGRRYGNEAVTWGVDLGTIVNSDATTDAVGEAPMTLRSPASPGTGTVTITSGSASAYTFCEYAAADAPSVLILDPLTSATVSGDVQVEVVADDPGGAHPGISLVSFTVDGQCVSMSPGKSATQWWRSVKHTNGPHILRATAVDYDGATSYSNTVTVTSQNQISAYNVTPAEVTSGQQAPCLGGPFTSIGLAR